MFAGFFHGAAMVGASGVPAKEFAARAADLLQRSWARPHEYGEVIDGGDYSVPGQQSLDLLRPHRLRERQSRRRASAPNSSTRYSA